MNYTKCVGDKLALEYNEKYIDNIKLACYCPYCCMTTEREPTPYKIIQTDNGYTEIFYEDEKNFEQSIYDHCACGHKIHEVYIFEGEYTKAVVGSICITKSVITNDTVKNKLKKDKSTKTKYARRMKKDKTEDWAETHARCLGSKKYEICGVLINNSEASWKKRCRDCHFQFKNPITEKRQCLECQLPILKSEPAYKVRCYDCHSKHKSK